MELIFRFFDKEEWSTYGTLNVIIPLVIFILFRQKLTASLLIFMSLLGMMHGDLLAKILFTGFLNFLVFENSLAWIGRSILLVISVVLMHMIPYKNPLHITVYNNELGMNMTRAAIIIWMSYILYLILKPLYKKYVAA